MGPRLFCYFLVLGLWLMPQVTEAVPSFARQTGQACTSCHVQAFGPNLTPYGREFKLNGYTAGGPLTFPPFSAMIQGSFTHTNGDQEPPPEGFGSNNNLTLDEAALFYAGRILPKLGAFIELTYEGGTEDKLLLDNSDIRLANQAMFGGQELVYGISANNAPTVQDLWNTTPAWGFPFVSSPLAPTPAAAALIDSTLDGQVGGATAYLMWNRLVYLEAGGYASFSRDVQRSLGTFEEEQNKINGGAPYWRVVLQRQLQNHYFALGHFGFQANVFPEREESAGTDKYTDLGADATYQLFSSNNRHIFEFKATYIHEDQDLPASQALGLSANASNTLQTVRFNGAYTFAQTVGVALGYFNIWGSRDTGLYAPEEISGSASDRPDSEGFIAELDYIPFGKVNSLLAPWLNLRFALQYVGYTHFNGGDTNYDGFGRDASDNNTLYLNGWLIF
jgi:hypothetical protein